ncbi:MAG TPA: glycogen synthase GlgA [Anaeromyxobacteraceae bacterium]|nr:glycogen synthase GlgA [Anaeromyxobacteraceae bacterium]
MDILYVASEVAPFSKSGGLGDVSQALPQALAARGHRLAVVTPRYGSIDPQRHRLARLDVQLEVRGERAGLWRAPGAVPVFLLEHQRWFGSRPGLYGERGADYPDNAQRFAFLSRAALEVPAAVGLSPRIVHLHDWQTALGAWLLRFERAGDPRLAGARCVFTIHNLAYQGMFPKEMLVEVGLPWEVFTFEAMEFHDQLNFMKAGLVYADALTTVSPNYAREILTVEGGQGLDSVLRMRRRDLVGILNGIDALQWDPSRDPHLPARYGPGDLSGKAACKTALQREMGLPARARVPLIGVIGRLAEQKGVDLLLEALPEILVMDVQVAVLGSGRPDWEEALSRTARERPGRLGVRIGFDEGLAHRIEAGADLFLMPSRFEPCGLNQLYSLRYGTAPVVRAVGGLEDTVEDYDGARRGTGFKFREYQARAMMTALRRALDVWRDGRAWRGLVERGMAQDFSWDRSAAGYEALYRRVIEPGG